LLSYKARLVYVYTIFADVQIFTYEMSVAKIIQKEMVENALINCRLTGKRNFTMQL